MLFNRTFKNIRRIREIIQVLIKYGFHDVVSQTYLGRYMNNRSQLKAVRSSEPTIMEMTRWERIRKVCEELGPTFIKLAQILSNRPDILPKDLITELQKLQSDVPPFSFAEVKRIFKEETGSDIKDLFEYFNETPLGSASIGQVHRARFNDGTDVVIKVRRPGVGRLISTDLGILKDLAIRGEKFFERNGVINVIDVVQAFEKSMTKELDYSIEARNIDMFRNTFRKDKTFYVPRAYKHYSTKKILVLEYVRGCKITDIDQLQKWGFNPADVAERGMDIYLKQIFEYGFFHADPHPGNVLVRKDGVICLIDFGMVGRLMKKDKFAFAGVFINMAMRNARGMAYNLRELAIEDNISDMRALESDLYELIEDNAHLSVEEANIAEFSEQLQKIIYEHRLRVPGGVFIILRALTILEGIGKMIHPTFNTSEFIQPYGRKLIEEKYSIENIGEELFNATTNIGSLAGSFPTDLRDIMVKLRKGNLSLQIDHQNYDRILKRLDRITNRIALTIIIAALLISSAIVTTVIDEPSFFITDSGFPYISIVGFSLAGVLMLILFYAMLRSRNIRD